MQHPPYQAADLFEVRRKPLKDISNVGRLLMAEAEKKIAESLVTIAVGEKESLRFQALKTLGLLKQELARAVQSLHQANEKISEYEDQKVIDNGNYKFAIEEVQRKAQESNDLMISMTADMKSAHQEHEAVVISMHFEREQFARRLFNLERKLLEATTTNADENCRSLLLAENAAKDAASEFRALISRLQEENNQMYATLQATAEDAHLTGINSAKRIHLLKAKLGKKTRENTLSAKSIIDLNDALIEIKQQLIMQQEEIALTSANLADQGIRHSNLISKMSVNAESKKFELQSTLESVQLYETQINCLQVELEDKHMEIIKSNISSEHQASALSSLLEMERYRTIELELQLGNLDEAAQLELDEYFDRQAIKDKISDNNYLILQNALHDMKIQYSMLTSQIIDKDDFINQLQKKLYDVELDNQSEKENQISLFTEISQKKMTMTKITLCDYEERIHDLTVELDKSRNDIKQISDDRSMMVLDMQRYATDALSREYINVKEKKEMNESQASDIAVLQEIIQNLEMDAFTNENILNNLQENHSKIIKNNINLGEEYKNLQVSLDKNEIEYAENIIKITNNCSALTRGLKNLQSADKNNLLVSKESELEMLKSVESLNISLLVEYDILNENKDKNDRNNMLLEKLDNEINKMSIILLELHENKIEKDNRIIELENESAINQVTILSQQHSIDLYTQRMKEDSGLIKNLNVASIKNVQITEEKVEMLYNAIRENMDKIQILTTTMNVNNEKAETLSVALSESEVKAETLSVALSESEVKAETLSVALSESEEKAEIGRAHV